MGWHLHTGPDGNSRQRRYVLAAAKVAAQKKTAKDSWNLGADGAYGEVSSVKGAESAHGFGQYNHIFVDDTWYGYGRSEAWHDAIANVAYRFSSGGGAGYYLHQKQANDAVQRWPGRPFEWNNRTTNITTIRRPDWRKILNVKLTTTRAFGKRRNPPSYQRP